MLRPFQVSMVILITPQIKAAHFRRRIDHCVHWHPTDMYGRTRSCSCSRPWHVVLSFLFDYLFHTYSLLEIGHVGGTLLQSSRDHASNLSLRSRPTHRRKNILGYNTLHRHDRPSNTGARFRYLRFGNTTTLPTSELPYARTRR